MPKKINLIVLVSLFVVLLAAASTALANPKEISLEDIIWDIDTNSDFRIVQFRVYEIPQ